MPEMDPNYNVTDLRRKLAVAQEKIRSHEEWLKADSQYAENQRLRAELAVARKDTERLELYRISAEAYMRALRQCLYGADPSVRASAAAEIAGCSLASKVEESRAAIALAESEPTDLEERPPSDEENRELDRLLGIAESAPEEQPPSGLMQMHGEVDEHGECPNCANPPHEGPCKRKQPSSYVLVDEMRKALRNGGPLADAVRHVIREEKALEQSSSGAMTIEQARIALHQAWTLMLPGGTYIDPWLELQERIAEKIRDIDHAARRDTLDWVLRQARDGWVIAGVVRHRLEGMK